MIFNQIAMFNPQTLTYCGFCCFESFAVHYDNDEQREKCITFFWKVILNSDAHIAHMAIVSLKNVYTKRTREFERHRVRSGQ